MRCEQCEDDHLLARGKGSTCRNPRDSGVDAAEDLGVLLLPPPPSLPAAIAG